MVPRHSACLHLSHHHGDVMRRLRLELDGILNDLVIFKSQGILASYVALRWLSELSGHGYFYAYVR